MQPESDQSAFPSPTRDGVDSSSPHAPGSTPAALLAQAKSLSPDERLWLVASVWSSLPAAHPAAPSPARQRELQGYLDDYAEGHIDTLPWQVVQGLVAGEDYLKSAKIYSVPRRFDLATIFVVTLAYSLLFGGMSALSCPPIASAMIAGFITIVGAAQAVLFGGKKPRMASIITGAVIYSVVVIAAWLYNGPRLYSVWQILIPAGFMVAGGGMLGYLSGVIIGGVFLVADKLRNRLSRRQTELASDATLEEYGTTEQGENPWTN